MERRTKIVVGAVTPLLCFLVGQLKTSVQVIVNRHAGQMANDESRGKLASLIEASYPGAAIEFTDAGMDVVRLAREAVQRGSAMIIAGGGDGTINGVASVVAGTATILGVLPLGTLNHFAKDLGIPTELEAAIQTLATGRVMAVDVAEVNGSLFVNNSALGLTLKSFANGKNGKGRAGQNGWRLSGRWSGRWCDIDSSLSG